VYLGEVSVVEQKIAENKKEECTFNKPSGLVFHSLSLSIFIVDSSSITPTIRKISFSK